MNDPELIAAVAKRLGWTSKGPIPSWYNPEGHCTTFPPWLASVDAALGVLGKKLRHREIHWLPDIESYEVDFATHLLADKHGKGRDKSFPRAILLAFLEAK